MKRVYFLFPSYYSKFIQQQQNENIIFSPMLLNWGKQLEILKYFFKQKKIRIESCTTFTLQ